MSCCKMTHTRLAVTHAVLRCILETMRAAPGAAFISTAAPRTFAAMLLGAHGYVPIALQKRFLPPLLRTQPPTSARGASMLFAQSLFKAILLGIGAYDSIESHAMYKAWEVIFRSDTQYAPELGVCVWLRRQPGMFQGGVECTLAVGVQLSSIGWAHLVNVFHLRLSNANDTTSADQLACTCVCALFEWRVKRGQNSDKIKPAVLVEMFHRGGG